jgi:RNA polymerase sigma-70 factor (ECF subfamily)
VGRSAPLWHFSHRREVLPARAGSIPTNAVTATEGEVVSIQGSFIVDEFQAASVGEAALVRSGQAGDRGALDQLLALHERRVLAVCRGVLGHAEDAEDAAQETLFRALRALPRFRGEASFRTWLLRIAVNVCLNWKRNRHPTEPWDEEDPLIPTDASPEALVLLRLQVREALNELPAHRRAVLLLREMEGWSVAEIGQAMRWNEKRVNNELFKARRTLAEWHARNTDEGAER